MSEAESRLTAEARARGYHLLARLMAEGPTEALRPAIAAIPDLAAALPPNAEADDVAADHHALFAFDILPYEAVFRAPDGLLGGPTTSSVSEAYAAAGWQPPDDGQSPDHVAVELAFMAWLAGLEADIAGTEDDIGGTEDVADRGSDAVVRPLARLRALQQSFLATHLLAWLPALAAAVAAAGPDGGAAFYGAVLGLAVELAADHGGAGDEDGGAVAEHGGGEQSVAVDAHDDADSDVAGDNHESATVVLDADADSDAEANAAIDARADVGAAASASPILANGAERLLAEPRTGLRDIARFLTSPARAGAYLGRGAVKRAARSAGVPHGFGDRATMLGDALAAAAHLERVAALTHALDAEVARQLDAMNGMRAASRDATNAVLERRTRPWAARAEASRWLLGQVATRADLTLDGVGQGIEGEDTRGVEEAS